MISLDRKYVKLLAPRLKKFSQKREDLYNFRCPFCGDSKKSESKARGYIYRKRNDYFYKCQNCGISKNLYSLIETLDNELLKEYILEKYKNGEETKIGAPMPEFKFIAPIFKKSIPLPRVSGDVPDFVKKYVSDRKIPEDALNRLYYAEDFKKFIDELKPDHGKNLIDGDKRLIIPFYGGNGDLLAVQGRSVTNSMPRYITIKLTEDSIKLFGLDTVDENEKIYVVEGPLDSLFLKNCVATADSNLMAAANYLPKNKMVLVFDNEPRNKDLHSIMNRAIDEHFQICIWPEFIKEKDINDMILTDFSPDEIQSFIDTNTFVNLMAKIEFLNWKKT